ncbi:hypothetical protein Lal_00027873 [Lupinus albus]|nr:hypothetical protein Lal_00027873 [Lupinus albus]
MYGSKLFINDNNIQEIQVFTKSLGSGKPYDSYNQRMSNTSSSSLGGLKTIVKTISELIQLDHESVCVTYGTIEKLFANGWYYDGCPNAIEKLMQLGFHLIVLVVERDGKLSEPNDGFALIEIPEQCLITNYDNPIHAIVKSTYPNLVDEYMNEEFLQCRAILASTIETVDEINDYVLSLILCRHSIIFFNIFINVIISLQGITIEFLNSLITSGLPNHKIKLKVGTSIMLLRNLDQTEGLCNGTRMIVNRLANHVIEAKKKCWENILHSTNEFVSISFNVAFQINKETISIDGQSLASVELYLPRPIFGHEQLYVVFLRVQSMEGLKILIHNKEGKTMNTTINVMFKEVFQNL